MAWLNTEVYDQGLDWLDTNAINLHIVKTEEPTTYALATTDGANSVGYKNAITVTVGDKAGGGREATITAITDGTVSDTGTAGWWAIVNPTGSILVATGALSAGQAVTDGNTFTLTSFTIGIPDPA